MNTSNILMEKTCHSSAPITTTIPTTTTTSTSSGGGGSCNSSSTLSVSAQTTSIRMLNKNSHKISKPIIVKHNLQHGTIINPNAPNLPTTAPPTHPTPSPPPPPPLNNQAPPPQPQPPVYNINKNDFRDVVQKLTGSPAHHNPRPSSSTAASPPPPPQPTKPIPPAPASASASASATSRLHRIRPPPLAHLGPRPPTLSQPDPTASADTAALNAAMGSSSNVWMRSSMTTPLSPLPPFPTVSAAAESPITAYMRYLRGGGGGSSIGSQQQQSLTIPSPGSSGAPLFPLPSSPLAFGCVPSPRSAFQTTLPPSPRLPMPSPKWKDL